MEQWQRLRAGKRNKNLALKNMLFEFLTVWHLPERPAQMLAFDLVPLSQSSFLKTASQKHLNLLELINKFGKVVGYIRSTQKSVMFFYTSDEEY